MRGTAHPHSIRMQLLQHLFPKLVEAFRPAELRELALRATCVSFHKGDVLVKQSDECASLLFVVGGSASLSMDKPAGTDAERVVMDTLATKLRPGSCVGEVALLLGCPHTHTVIADTSVACLALTHDAFITLLQPLARWLVKKWGHSQVGAQETQLCAVAAAHS